MSGAQSVLDRVLTIPEVAALAGWNRVRMWRHLSRLNDELGGMLLRNTNPPGSKPRWTITLRALQAIAPQWFHDPEAIQRQIDKLNAELREIRRMQTHHGAVIELHTARLSELASVG